MVYIQRATAFPLTLKSLIHLWTAFAHQTAALARGPMIPKNSSRFIKSNKDRERHTHLGLCVHLWAVFWMMVLPISRNQGATMTTQKQLETKMQPKVNKIAHSCFRLPG